MHDEEEDDDDELDDLGLKRTAYLRHIAVERDRQKNSKWFRWATFWTTRNRSIILIIIVLSITIPVAYFSGELVSSTDMSLLFPDNSAGMQVMKSLQSKFPPGMMSPYRIQIERSDGGSIWNSDFFSVNNILQNQLLKQGVVKEPSQITSLSNLMGEELPFDKADFLMKCGQDLCKAYQYLADHSLNDNRTSALNSIVLDFDSLSHEAEDWVKLTRATMTEFESDHSEYNLYLSGGAVGQIDLVDKVNSYFPKMIVATCCVLFFLIGLIFKSVFIPLRGILTIGLSIVWTFGIAVLCFQKCLDQYIYWLAPIMSFSVLVGLGMDYDIFLISRIVEYRTSEFSTNASIVKGVYRTGSIITGAGVIMSIAFFGLIFSEIALLRQFSVILTAAVLLDTFVVRTALVPAIMHLAGPVNFWPNPITKFPESRQSSDFISRKDQSSDIDDIMMKLERREGGEYADLQASMLPVGLE